MEVEGSMNPQTEEGGPVLVFYYPGLKTKTLLLQRPARMLSFYQGSFSVLFTGRSRLCYLLFTAAETIVHAAS